MSNNNKRNKTKPKDDSNVKTKTIIVKEIVNNTVSFTLNEKTHGRLFIGDKVKVGDKIQLSFTEDSNGVCTLIL